MVEGTTFQLRNFGARGMRRRGFRSIGDISENAAPLMSPESAALAFITSHVPAARNGEFKVVCKGNDMLFISSDKNVRFQVEALAEDLASWLKRRGLSSPRRILWPRN